MKEGQKNYRTTPTRAKERPKALAVSRLFVYAPSLRSFGEELGGYYYA